MALVWSLGKEAAGQVQMPWNLLSLKPKGEYKTTNTCTNKAQSERTSTPWAPARMCTARSGVRGYSQTDTWAASGWALSLAKWILHSADMWYLNFLLEGEYVSEGRRSVMRACLQEAVNGTPCFKVEVCRGDDKDEMMEGESWGRKLITVTGSTIEAFQGVQRLVLLESQLTWPDHCNLQWRSVPKRYNPSREGDRNVSLHQLERLPVCQFGRTELSISHSGEKVKRGQHQTPKHDRAGSFCREEAIDFSSISPSIWWRRGGCGCSDSWWCDL